MGTTTGELGPGVATDAPGWLVPSMRLAMWLVRECDGPAGALGTPAQRRAIRAEMRAERGLMNAARRLLALGRDARRPRASVAGMYVVGQVAIPSDADVEGPGARAWERIRAGGARALDTAQRAAARMYDAAGRLGARWREARQTEANVISELRDGIAHFAHGLAQVPERAARFMEGGGVVLLLLVGAALLATSSSRR